MILKSKKVDIERRKSNFKKRFPQEAKHFFKFLDLAEGGEINKGKSISPERQVKYADMLIILLDNVKVDLGKKTPTKKMKEVMRKYHLDLKRDVIRKKNGQPYSPSTKQDNLINTTTYLRYRRPHDYHELTDFFDKRVKEKEIVTISKEEYKRLLLSCTTAQDRFIYVLLGDGGLRIGEAINTEVEDIIEPNESFPYYKIRIKPEHSKTLPRTIGLYMDESTEIIKEYLKEIKDFSSKDKVITKDYDAIRQHLHRLAKRKLSKRVHPHMLRKFSATTYASKLNRQQLANRYGWKFSSSMMDVYISRVGVEEENIKDEMLNEDLSDLKKENNELKTKMNMMIEDYRNFKDDYETMKKVFETLKEDLKNV